MIIKINENKINFPYVNYQFRFVVNLTIRNREDARACLKNEDYFQAHLSPVTVLENCILNKSL